MRVGEVYLQDAPFHAGAGAVDYRQPFATQQAEYVALLEFLRAELCVKHGKRVIFRTWVSFWGGLFARGPPRGPWRRSDSPARLFFPQGFSITAEDVARMSGLDRGF